MEVTQPKQVPPLDPMQKKRELTMMIYALQAASFLLGLTFLIAVIINYVKRDEVKGTYLESHFKYQIRTFWYITFAAFIGLVTFIFVIGAFILFATAIWLIVRIIKGWLKLNEGKPIA